MDTLTIARPDDWHLHLRDGAALATTVAAAARHFGRGIIMPNLTPPVTTTAEAQAYRQRILDQRPAGNPWQPLMVLYLTDDTSPAEIRRARDSGIVYGAKVYPAGATTNSAAGVTDLNRLSAVLDTLQDVGLPLLLHGEVTDDAIDIFDREAVFIDRYLNRIIQDFPALKVVLEHITTREGAQFVAAAREGVAATITPQHLLFNRNHMLVGGMRPHYYCLPILKRNIHQDALIAAALSGSPRFFLGTDSAPHARHRKEAACGCAGCYSHHAAVELYAEFFHRHDAMHRLEAFASFHGADFYGLPRNSDTLTLVREPWQLPATVALGDESMVPLMAGETLNWRIIHE